MAASRQSGKPERFEAPAAAARAILRRLRFPVRRARGTPRRRAVPGRQRAQGSRGATRDADGRAQPPGQEHAGRRPGACPLAGRRRTQTVDQYRERLIGRIQALARAHDQLLETHWQSADLKTLIDATLLALWRDRSARSRCHRGSRRPPHAEAGARTRADPARTRHERIQVRVAFGRWREPEPHVGKGTHSKRESKSI